MKYNSKKKNMKKGVSMALTAMMVLPTTTATFAAPAPTNETNKAIKTENTPYNVLNQKVLSNPISTAKPAKDTMNVYTSFTMSVSSNAGDGSIQNPYNRFEDAVAQVADGGTIYINSDKGAFLNAQDEYGHLPFIIDKNITIKPVDGATNAELSVRTGGIILGADVTFENITLSFANKYHDSIFANGHTLNLINVTRGVGAREIDVFAGGLYEREGNVDSTTPIYPIGDKGVINIETNDNFGGNAQMSVFGNLYAGSMNGKFDGSAEINLSNNGKYKKLDLKSIKASGALEADVGDMFDLEEPLPPAENPGKYPTMGDVTINLNNYQISVDGTTGSDEKTNVSTSTVYPSNLSLKNVDHLTVKDGHITAMYENTATTPNVTLENGATLDLTKAEKEFTIENYNGNGIVMLRKDGKLNITNPMNGSIELQTEGAFNGTSGLVEQDHVYITTSNENANITFKPHATQTYLELVGNKTDTVVEWKIQEPEESTKLAQIKEFIIEDADAKQVKKYDEINKPNDTGGMDYETVKFPFKALTDLDPNDLDAWVDLNEYPFEITVNGKKAEYREDKDGIGTHYFVEDLELAFYFTSETYFDEHNLAVIGYTKDGNLAPIKEGEYEIHVSHDKNDGTSAEFTSYLTVTNDNEPPTEDVKPDKEGWLKTTTLAQANQLWNHRIDEKNKTIVLESFKGIDSQSDDVKVEIPRTVEGYKVVLANLNTETFKDVTHIRVAEGDEEFVKVLATDLSNGFKNNDTLKYVDLEGLNVSGVTNMSELFSMCNNLQVIKITDWVIRDSTSIMGMFYAKMAATYNEKKILVITNDLRIHGYNFEASNRIPCIVTFSGNGGHFLGDEEILNYKIPRYTIDTDVFEDVEKLVENDKSNVVTPTREGYEFKEWYTEDATPTNVYELLNMTYKAKWEKVVEEEKPEQPPVDDDKTDEGENGDTTQPPSNGGAGSGDTGSGNGSGSNGTTPDSGGNTGGTGSGGSTGEIIPNPNLPENKPTSPTNTHKIDLEGLDEKLKEKVDSLVMEVTAKSPNGFSLSFDGDKNDINSIESVTINKDGLFITVENTLVKVTDQLPNTDFANGRVVRIVDDKVSTVMHHREDEGLKITSSNLQDLFVTPRVSEPFSDVGETDWYYKDVEDIFNYMITQGTTATTYSPNNSITRGQFATMIARALEITHEDTYNTYKLADLEGTWYANEVQMLVDLGIITGYKDGTFGGENKLTRQQAAAIIVRMLEHMGVDTTPKGNVAFSDMDRISDYAKEAVQFLASQDVLNSGEDTKFNPYNNLTRAQMAKVLMRSLRLSDWY